MSTTTADPARRNQSVTCWGRSGACASGSTDLTVVTAPTRARHARAAQPSTEIPVTVNAIDQRVSVEESARRGSTTIG